MDVRVGFQIAPAQCFVCGNGDQSLTVVDLGEHPDMVRRFRIYICAHCVVAAAQRAGGSIGYEIVESTRIAEWRGAARAGTEAILRAEAAEAKLAEVAEFARGVTG